MVKYYLILFLTIIIGCNKNDNPKKYDCLKNNMTFWGNYKNNSTLKLNGYFYYRQLTDTIKYPKSYRIFLFYDNGILYHSGLIILNNNTLEQQILNDIYNNKDNDALWGCYIISDNLIMTQTLVDFSDRSFRKCIDVVNEKGTILNDSTFEFSDRYGVNTIYKYAYENPKPDSINLFISILGAP